jgi:uncharacterized membrane protein
MDHKIFYLAFFVLLIMVSVQGCYYDNAEDLYPVTIDTTDTTPTFKDDIQPLITTSCASSGCHAAGASNPVLETYGQIKSQITRIEARAIVEKTMPQSDPKPTEKELADLKTWIDSGAPND